MGLISFWPGNASNSRVASGRVQHCTWLDFSPCAPSGTGACRRRWRKQAGGASGIAGSGRRARLCEVPGSIQHGEKRPGESCSRAIFSRVQHCTWLGFPSRAAGGTGAERVLWATQRGGASGIAGSGRRARLCEFSGGRERDGKRLRGPSPGPAGRNKSESEAGK